MAMDYRSPPPGRLGNHTPMRTRAIVMVAALATMAAAFATPHTTASAQDAPSDDPSAEEIPIQWLATGDSYSAGLGLGIDLPCVPGVALTPLIDQICLKMTLHETFCLRNPTLAYGPLTAEILNSRGWRIDTPTFTPCTGSVTEHLFNTWTHEEGGEVIGGLWGQHLRDGGSCSESRHTTDDACKKNGETWTAGPDTVDIITMSMGGNDVGFPHVLRDCVRVPDENPEFDPSFVDVVGFLVSPIVSTTKAVIEGGAYLLSDVLEGCGTSEDDLKRRIDNLLDPSNTACLELRTPIGGGVPGGAEPNYECEILIDARAGERRGSIVDLYVKIVEDNLTHDGNLYIVGYPHLFAPVDELDSWARVECELITLGDVDMLNGAADHLNDRLSEAVQLANDSLKRERVHYLDPGRLYRNSEAELCGKGSDWLFGLDVVVGCDMLIGCSFHPKKAGHEATADALAKLVARTAIDGQPRIAFASDRNGARQIFTMSPDGETEQRATQITKTSGDKHNPDWSPDGKAIIFSHQRGSSNRILITDANGTLDEQLSGDDDRDATPRWSPDGSRIAFVHIPEGNSEIWVMETDGSHRTRLAAGSSKYNPSWSASSGLVAFDAVTGELLVTTPSRSSGLDSLFRSLDDEGAANELGVNEGDTVVLVDRDGTTTNSCADWSPDGSEMVFVSDRDGDEEIFIMNSDGIDQRQITENGAIVGCPDWSPDGLEIMFSSDRDGDSEIFTMSVDGSGLRKLTDNNYDDFQARYSPLVESMGRHRPTEAPEGDYGAVSSGWDHACALSADRAITCWGNNVDGQADASDGSYSTVSAGDGHTCALSTDGAIECWGNNFFGQADAPEGSYSAVAAGWDHSCGLGTGGTVTCWGTNQYGQSDAPAGTYSAVSVGNSYSCALRTNATITCWGNSSDGQSDAPAGTYSAIAAGTAHTCALGTDNMITCWGANWLGQADAPSGSHSAIAAGDRHSCAVLQDGTLTCWGDNSDYQSSTPEDNYTAITAGSTHSCAIGTDNTIICWGSLESPSTEE